MSIQTFTGEKLPVHTCAGPRSERGKAVALVFGQWNHDAGTFHPQLSLASPGGAQVIGIVHCPFCGVRLQPTHFGEP